MNITLYQSDKKPNSTKLPSGGTSFECEVYETCSVVHPQVLIGTADPTGYNYARIPKWGRYYFVQDWTWTEGRWLGTLNCDVLASYRAAIGASSQYVARAAAMYNPGIPDNVWTTYASPTYAIAEVGNPWDGELETGCYVVGVLGKKTKYYAMTPGQLNILMDYIFSDAYLDELLTEGEVTLYPELRAQTNPLQYISSVTWFPVQVGGYTQNITVGWVETPASGDLIPDISLGQAHLTFTVPRHPQGGKGSYLNLPPYAQYNIYFPPFGMVPIPSDAAAAFDTIVCRALVDTKTGEAILVMEGPSGETLSRVTSKLGMQIQLAQITAPGVGLGTVIQGVASTVGDIAGAVGSALSGNVAGAVGGVANTIGNAFGTLGNAAAARIPSVNAVGSAVGGVAAMNGQCKIVANFLPIVSRDSTNKGLPLCQIQTVSALGGYMEVLWPHLEVQATQPEVAQIYAMMEGGFYYE